METSTLVSVDDVVEMLPSLGEPLPKAKVGVSDRSSTRAAVVTSPVIILRNDSLPEAKVVVSSISPTRIL